LTAEFSKHWKRRGLLMAYALCSATAACVLAGVAFMLWFVSPIAQTSFPWPLVVAPLVPLVAFLWCLMKLNAAAG
jgi:F0F1-type ATP synthase assembly protein I